MANLMKNVSSYEEFVLESKSISDLPDREEKPMVKGIAEIIRRVKDLENRKEMIEASIEDFKREGIDFDYEEFRNLCK